MNLKWAALCKTFSTIVFQFDLKECKPGNPHTNIIGQGYDGADGDGELDARTGKLVVFVNVSNNHRNNHQRKEVWYFLVKGDTTSPHGSKTPQDRPVKDTNSKHIDAIHCVLVVVPVDSLVAAQ